MKNSPCAGCAFKPGTPANSEPHNNIKGRLCAFGAIPFYCHETIDYKRAPSQMTREQMRASGIGICAGWQREVAELTRGGFFRKNRLIIRAYAQAGLDALAEFIHPEDPEAKERARTNLRDILKALVRARSKAKKGTNDAAR